MNTIHFLEKRIIKKTETLRASGNKPDALSDYLKQEKDLTKGMLVELKTAVGNSKGGENMKEMISEAKQILNEATSLPNRIAIANQIWVKTVQNGKGYGPFEVNASADDLKQKYNKSGAAMMIIQNIIFNKHTVELTNHGSFYMPEKNDKGEFILSPKHAKGEVLNNIPAGSTVRLSGKYTESLICNNTLNIVGEEGTVFEGNGKSPKALLYIMGNNSKVKNISFTNETKDSMCMSIRGAGTTVEECDFKNFHTGIQSLESDVVIQNNSFDNCKKDGIIFCGDGTQVINNTFLNHVGGDGAHNDWVQMFKGSEEMVNGKKQYFKDRFSGNHTLSGFDISGNTFGNFNESGKDLDEGKSNKKLQGITGFNLKMKDGKISGNRMSAAVASQHAITVQGAENLEITNNQIKGRINITRAIGQETGKNMTVIFGTDAKKVTVSGNTGEIYVDGEPTGIKGYDEFKPFVVDAASGWIGELPAKSYEGSQKDLDPNEGDLNKAQPVNRTTTASKSATGSGGGSANVSHAASGRRIIA